MDPSSSGNSILVSTIYFQSFFDPCGDDGPPSPITCHHELLLAPRPPPETLSKCPLHVHLTLGDGAYICSQAVMKRNSAARLLNIDTESRIVASCKWYILYCACSLSLLKSHLLDLRQTAVVLTPIRAEGLGVDQYSLPIANRL